jgi:tRNA(Ile)-lysidine synthase
LLQSSLLHRIFLDAKIDPSKERIDETVELFGKRKGSRIELSGGYSAEVGRNDVAISKRNTGSEFTLTIPGPGKYAAGLFTVDVKEVKRPRKFDPDPRVAYADASLLSFPLMLRSWRSGDTMVPFGMKGKKKISDIFSDAKIDRAEKSKYPVLLSGGAIVWLGGIRADERFKVTQSTTHIVRFTLTFHR